MTETTGADKAQAYIAEAINTHPMVLFMKGTPAHPQCGFSAAVVAVLRHYDVPVHAIDVLADPAISQERTPKQIPWVERPPGRLPTVRHGQIASQLQDSK